MIVLIVLSLFVVSFFPESTYAQRSAETAEGVVSDSIAIARKKLPKRETWEEVVSLPGRIVFFPVQVFLKGSGHGIAYLDDQKVFQKIDDFLTSDDGRRGLFPTYAARSGAGVKFYQKGFPNRSLEENQFEATVTAWDNQRQFYGISFDEYLLIDKSLPLGAFAQYWKLPDEAFYGLGPGSLQSAESSFSIEQMLIEFNIRTMIQNDWGLSGALGVESNAVFNGKNNSVPSTNTVYTETSLPGISGRAVFNKIAVSLQQVNRNKAGNPDEGYDVEFGIENYVQINGDDYGFTRVHLDMSEYVHLFHKRVLVLRAAGQIGREYDGKNIPFYYLSEIGREEYVRGYTRGRFHDRDMFMISAEYRYPVWNNWGENGGDFFIFADAGQVAANIFSEMAINDLAEGYGFGLRFWDWDGLTARFMAGKSADGWRIYVGLN